MPTPRKNDADRRYALLGFAIVGEFGAVIAVPVVVLTVIGKRLDAAYGTGHTYLIGGFAVSAVLSAIYVVRRAKAYAKTYQAIDKEASKKDTAPPTSH
jgi:membrane protein implicated in regulation of membrane protease activity